jgi:hypothetical protein
MLVDYSANGSITRNDGDGTSLIYIWDGASKKYICKSGSGAFDTLELAGGIWAWRDGSTGQKETYDATTLKIQTCRDREGNTAYYGYTGSLLTSVTDAPAHSIERGDQAAHERGGHLPPTRRPSRAWSARCCSSKTTN